MRHKLSYDLFRAMSSPGQPRYAVASRFVEAILNDQYVGVYLLMERIDRDLLKLARFSSNNTEHAVIYKAVDHSANFSQPGHAGFEQQEPDPLALSYWKPLQDLNQFISTAPAEEFFDPTSGIASRVDLQNAIDFHLLVLLTSNHDGITKNFILARDRTEGAKFFFVPWDYDGTFGRNWNAQKLPADSWLSNHLFDRLFSNPKIQESYRSRWLELRRGPFATARIQEMIEENARSIRLGMERNQRRWQSASGWYPDSLTFEEDIREMKEWVAARGAFLDERFKEKPR
jgi:spore coat protein CotH